MTVQQFIEEMGALIFRWIMVPSSATAQEIKDLARRFGNQ